MSTLATTDPPRSRSSAWRRRLAIVAVSALLTLLAGELALRALLFGSSTSSLARRLRHAEWYVPGFDADYWKLQARFTLADARPPPNADARLGWTGDVEPRTYAHPDEAKLGARTPVLLYGDSFAECVTPPEQCWQGLLERSDLAATHALLNYGVRGYGLDQVALLLESSLPRFAGRDPAVLVGVFVDDDLERCSLPIRGWAKPSFALVDGELTLHEPGLDGLAAALERDPPRIASYLLRLIRRAVLGAGSFEHGSTDASTLPARRELCRAILARIVATLDAAGVSRRAFVLLEGQAALEGSPRARWQRDLVRDFARERAIACVSTAPFVLEAIGGDVGALARVTAPAGSVHAGHYDEVGNRVAFEAMLQALRGDDGSRGLAQVRAWREAGLLEPPPEERLRFTFLDRPVYCCTQRGAFALRIQEPPAGPARLSLRPASAGPTTVELELRGARRFSARARVASSGDSECGVEPLVLAIGSSTGATAHFEIAPGTSSIAIDHALDGERLRLSIDRAGEQRDRAWLVLEDVRFTDG